MHLQLVRQSFFTVICMLSLSILLGCLPTKEEISDETVIENANKEFSENNDLTKCSYYSGKGKYESVITNRYDKKFNGEDFQCFEIKVIFKSPVEDASTRYKSGHKSKNVTRVFFVEHGYIKRGNRWEQKVIKPPVVLFSEWEFCNTFKFKDERWKQSVSRDGTNSSFSMSFDIWEPDIKIFPQGLIQFINDYAKRMAQELNEDFVDCTVEISDIDTTSDPLEPYKTEFTVIFNGRNKNTKFLIPALYSTYEEKWKVNAQKIAQDIERIEKQQRETLDRRIKEADKILRR